LQIVGDVLGQRCDVHVVSRCFPKSPAWGSSRSTTGESTRKEPRPVAVSYLAQAAQLEQERV
jgi:hypothetical protein